MVEVMQEMGGWKQEAIMNEAWRLMHKYFWLLRPFFFSFLVPGWIIQLLILSWNATSDLPHRSSAFFKASDLPVTMVIVPWLIITLAIAAIAKAVEYIYTDTEEEDRSIVIKSIFKSLKEAFPRLFITSIWIFAVYSILSLAFYILKEKATGENVHGVFLFAAVLVMGLLSLFFIFLLQVAVLEPESYGLQRAFKLLQTKWLTALALFVIYFFHFFCFLQFITIGKLSWTWCLIVGLLELVGLALAAYWLVVMAVFYFSCKLKCQQLLPVHDLYSPLAVSADN